MKQSSFFSGAFQCSKFRGFGVRGLPEYAQSNKQYLFIASWLSCFYVILLHSLTGETNPIETPSFQEEAIRECQAPARLVRN